MLTASAVSEYREAYRRFAATIQAVPVPAIAPPEFDAASVKPYGNVPLTAGGRTGGGASRLEMTPGRVAGRGVSAQQIILEAYQIKDYQLFGAPAWASLDRFDLEAKTNPSADANQIRLMLQTLLRTRFKLAVHRETRDRRVYALTVGRNGSKLRERIPGEPLPSVPSWVLDSTAERPSMFFVERMQNFVDRLNRLAGGLDRPVLDKTGLAGVYLFAFQWRADEDVKSAVEDQLGLKFVPENGPMEILVIDQIERPDAN
jgi:uncharacterized protein (TIGR03435 family)